jgi:gelsolin
MQGGNACLLQAANAWFATLASPDPAPTGERSIGMLRPTPQLAVKDSNMANFGTKLEFDIKNQAAQTEKAWAVTGKSAGLWSWRVNKFKLEAVSNPGTFFAGDSYVVLNTRAVVKSGVSVLSHDVHFWLGGATTQDEAGTAAYKTVELDDYLKREAVQHREVQGHESELFLSYFAGSGGLCILDGGAETGFNTVKPESWRPRLLQIKGRKLLRVREVTLARDSLNSGDCFILDQGLTIFQWSGTEAAAKEKGRSAQLTRAMQEERKGRAKIVVEEQGKESDAFWKALPGGKGPIASAAAGGVDDEVEGAGPMRRLFKLSDESGKCVFSKLQEGQLDRKLLDSKVVLSFSSRLF